MILVKQAGKKGWAGQLVIIFLAWKALLLVLATICPSPGYDTSALILLDPSTNRHQNVVSRWPQDRLVLNLFRWDSIYFIAAAKRNKVHEQEWAFSWAYSWLLRLAGHLLAGHAEPKLWHYIVAGIVISNICHLLSVFVLHQLLTISLGPQQPRQVPFVAAILHIITPASLFMFAPYAEPMFSFLNLAGMLCYVHSRVTARANGSSIQEDVYKLGAGLFFGLATLMRSNGLLSGLVLVYDLAGHITNIIPMQLTVHDVRRIIITCAAGVLVALGYVWPQYLAYTKFCNQDASGQSPVWCTKTIPSIYSWVQSHYWNVGLFRYWTLSNLPLFLLAAPMLWLLLESSVTLLCNSFQPPMFRFPVPRTGVTEDPKDNSAIVHLVPELAIPQFVLAIAAATSFHVQIINRIASGYPTWYLVVATWLVEEQSTSINSKVRHRSQWISRAMVVYAITQGMLFANFLPPA